MGAFSKESLMGLLATYGMPAMRCGDFDDERVETLRSTLFPQMAAACHMHGVPLPEWLRAYDQTPARPVILGRRTKA